MSKDIHHKSGAGRTYVRRGIFPVIMLAVYGILFVLTPDKFFLAIKSSGDALLNMLFPLGLVFVFMLLLNLFLKPAAVAKFLGKGSGIRGVLLSGAAGIISTGPIYAWYPLLKDLKKKGAGDSPIAIFLYNRAVKPFLLPVMVTYFGWLYVAVLTVLIMLGSIALGFSINAVTGKEGIRMNLNS